MAAVWQQLQGVLGLWLLVAVGGALVAGCLRSPAVKGWWGERKVQRWLARDLDAQHYHCVHNVTLRLGDGNTTQIDHVVVSPYGVFVLEIKHMQGWIYGTENQRLWTQTIYRHRSQFQNPLHQNWRHIKALEEVLQLPVQHLYSVVVFTGDCEFKTAVPAHVTQGRRCTAWIRSHTAVVLDAARVQQLVQVLAQLRLPPSRRTHQAHVAQLQVRHSKKTLPMQPRKAVRTTPAPRAPALAPSAMAPETERSAERIEPQMLPTANVQATPPANACPECGDALVHRHVMDRAGAARYFWRCGRFPHCRFVLAAEACGAPL